MSTSLGDATIRLGMDVSSFKSSISQAKDAVVGFADTAESAIKTVSGIDTAAAKVTLLESDVRRASVAYGELQNAASQGKMVLGLDEAEAKLVLLQAKAQAARANLEQLRSEANQDGAALQQGFNQGSSAVQRFGDVVSSAFSKVKEGASTVGERISGFTSGISGAAGSFLGGIGSMVGGLVNFGSQIGMTVIGLQGLYQGVVGFGKALLGGNASMEQTFVAFKGLLGGAKAAREELARMQTLADKTPFEFPDIARSTQALLAFQFSTKQSESLITDISDALSAMGDTTPAALQQVVTVFGQMNAAGKIQTQDLQQLQSVGINGFQIMANEMHKPVSVIHEMVTKGLIPAQQGIELLQKGMHQAWGGQSAAQAQTFNGLLSTMSDSIGTAWRAFTGSAFEAAKGSLKTLGDMVSSKQFQDFASMLGDKVGGALKTVGEIVGQVAIAFKSPEFAELGGTIRDIVAPAFQKAGEILSGIFKSGMESISVSKISDISTSLRGAASAINDFLRGIAGFQTGSSGFAQAGQGIRAAALQVWSVLQSIGSFLAFAFTPVWNQLVSTWDNHVKPAFDDLVSTFQMLAPTLVPFSEAIGTVLVGALMGLTLVVAQVAEGIVGAFGGVVQFFSGFVQSMAGQIAFFADIFSGNWQNLATDLQGIWNGILDMIKGGLVFINSITGGMLSQLVGLFGGNFDQITGKSSDLKNNVSGNTSQMKTNVTNNANTMKDNVNSSFDDMTSHGTGKSHELDDKATAIMKGMGLHISGKFSDLNKDTQSYWTDIAAYIEKKSKEAADKAQLNLDSIHMSDIMKTALDLQKQRGFGNGILNHNFIDSSSTNGYAEGGDVPKTGVYTVGEKGPEKVVLRAGSHVYPHGVYPSQGSSGSGGPIQIHNHIQNDLKLYVDGQELVSILVDPLGQAIVDRIRAEGHAA